MSVTACLTELSADEIQACRADPALLAAILADRSRPSCGLDKAWAGLRFLFVAGDYPLEAAMLDVEQAEKLGAYQVRFVSPSAMHKLADDFDWEGRADDLARYYAPERMAGVYPDIWARDGDAALRYLLSFIPALREFTGAAADRKAGAVVVIG
ncbi:DUF1877 family protein [Nannocystis punicea]|uniref:DUF1877 family protein n=1 Tax=Nannocystis punicea TaxID=2995304 RepID=A0ABY7H0B8_9BACT|nr:DUF1877 family protein [Nannocystis poenicansa]WAS92647.1 DUF1877 family protein [Nannocystis poenicansa]